jgi:hypothetical protein
MAKFFLALIGISVATLVGTFVFAAFALQATHLLAPTTVAMRVTPTFIMRDVEQGESRITKKQTGIRQIESCLSDRLSTALDLPPDGAGAPRGRAPRRDRACQNQP